MSIVVVGDRASGKTHRLVGWLKQDETRMALVPYEQTARVIEKYGIARHRITTPYRAERDLRGRTCEVGVDEVLMVLDAFLNAPGNHVEMITLTARAEVLQSFDLARTLG